MPFESITDERVHELLMMAKRVTNPNARAKNIEGRVQYNYKVVSENDKELRFELFTRQNSREGMEDDFSCGLSWLAPNGESLILCRYNGSSHTHSNRLENEALGYVYHIHKSTERYIRANRKPEGFAEETDKYYTLLGALHCLVSDCNITGLTTVPDMPKLF